MRVRTANTVPAATRGFDAGKKLKGRKRFIVAYTLGLLLAVHETSPAHDRLCGNPRRQSASPSPTAAVVGGSPQTSPGVAPAQVHALPLGCKLEEDPAGVESAVRDGNV